jgi:hypothetical protein
VVGRLFLIGLAVYAVAVVVQRVRERQSSGRREDQLSVEQRLARLDELLRRELITRAEYNEARLRIISGDGGPIGDDPRR